MENEVNIFAEFADESRLDSNQDCGSVAHAVVDNANPPPLFNARQPAYILQAERPEHRIIVELKSTGKSLREIAEVIGWSPTSVGYIVKQPWAQEYLIKKAMLTVEPALELLRNATVDSALRLIEIAESAENEETKRKANNDVLDRVFGKASQPILMQTKSATDLTDDELARIAGQAKKN